MRDLNGKGFHPALLNGMGFTRHAFIWVQACLWLMRCQTGAKTGRVLPPAPSLPAVPHNYVLLACMPCSGLLHLWPA